MDEASNFVELCAEHHEENDAYWRERWDDYYAGIGYPQYGAY